MNDRFLTRSIKYFVFLMSIIFFFISPITVEAHSSLKDTYPKADQTLEDPPSNVEVWFQDPVVIHDDSIQVFDSDGNLIESTKPKLDPNESGHIITGLQDDIGPGKYTVKINVIAQDGYVINESFSFSIQESMKAKVDKELKLVKTNITDGEIHYGSPETIELWFNQPTKVTAFGLFDENLIPVGTGMPKIDKKNPNHITIPIPKELSAGTFKIAWYASPINAENQTIQDRKMGIFYFAVDKFSPMTPLNEKEVKTDWNISTFHLSLTQLAYWLMFIGMTILFGLSWFSNMILKRQVTYVSYNKSILFFYILSLIGIGLLIFDFRQSLTSIALKGFVSIKFVWVPIIQLLLMSIGLWTKKLRPWFFGIALLLMTFIIGHASYLRYGGSVTMILTSAHIIAAGIWMGGLYGLIVKPKHMDSREWFKIGGTNFSKSALVSIIFITITGLLMANQMLPSFTIKSLIESEWGIALIGKILLFIVIVVLGYFQRKSIKSNVSKLSNLILKRGRIEIVYGLLILFLASSLVAANPSAAEKGIYPEQTKQQDLNVNVDITPLEMGLNTVTLDFKNDSSIKEVKVELSMPPIWRIKNRAFKVDEGVYKLTGNILHASGTVNMKVLVELENGELIKLPYRVVVPGEVRFNE